jgi:hypothetical protein
MNRMTKRRKLTFVAGASAVALLLTGLGAAGAIAASDLLSPSEESEAIIDDAAGQLGVEPDALSDALKQALKNRVDEAVEEGRLTEEQGQELKERIDSDEFPLLFGGGWKFGGPEFGFHADFEILGTAASYLEMTEAELREALQDKTLAEVAKANGKSVSGLVQALVAAQEKRIDAAVADGRLTKAQAAELNARIAEKMEALVNGEFLSKHIGPHLRVWPGSGFPRAPPVFGGPSV